jgi:hypothetical protein
MTRAFHTAILLGLLLAIPATVRAGWVSDWTNTAVKPNGDPLDKQSVTMAIANGRVRMQQPNVVTLIDYNTDRFTMINPTKHTYWTGTIDDYVKHVGQNRQETMRKQLGTQGLHSRKLQNATSGEYKPPKIDVAKLPPVSVTKTDVTERIAGYDAVKYEARANGELFQEFWVAPSLNVSSDLDPTRYFAGQEKLSAGMAGKSGPLFNALYRDPEYRKLLDSGFILKVVNHHIGGQFERVATSMRQADVPATEFEVPADYRRVSISDVLSTPPQGS